MKRIVFMTLALAMLMPSLSFAQDYSRYTPYGLRFPLLQKGEYNLSVSGSYYESEYESGDVTSGYSYKSNSFDNYMYLSAAYALSSQFIVSGSFSYYPSRITSNYLSVSPGPTYTSSHGVRDGYVYPNISLAYKPTAMMELFTSFYSSSSNFKNISETSSSESNNKSSGFSFGLNYIGQF
jgi:hypothetical protein